MSLKDLRLNKNMTQQELADHVGVSKTLISKIETGERQLIKASFETVIKLAITLDTNIFDMFGD